MFKDEEAQFSTHNFEKLRGTENYGRIKEVYTPNLSFGGCFSSSRANNLSLPSSSCSGDEEMSPVGGGKGSSCSIRESPQGGCCLGCGLPILDRFYVRMGNATFHASCLKCHACDVTLSEEPTCFEKDGRILCKRDYYRIYHEANKFFKRCARCTNIISANDLVMKVRDFVYHNDCFVCTICQRAFSRGDHFRMQSTDLYCKLHYDVVDNTGISEEPDLIESHLNEKPSLNSGRRGRPPKKKSMSGSQDKLKDSNSSINYFHSSKPTGIANVMRNAEFQHIMDPSLNGYSMTPMPQRNGEISPVSLGEVSSQTHQKGKRMRTTFKHNQLRIMKQYFEINPNPDTKDLKQLSQKTGLCKRVLQVWFQNSRAKSRRSSGRTDGRADSGMSGSGILALEDSGGDLTWSPQPSHLQSNCSDSNASLPMPQPIHG